MLIDIQTIISQLPNYAFWKDCDSIFRACNSEFAHIAGLASTDEVIGKSDYELPWGNSHADYYRQKDQEVLSGKDLINDIETQLQASGNIVTVLVNKSKLCNNKGKVLGVICQYSPIPIVVASAQHMNLTKKQRNVLEFVGKGFSAKKIASLLHMSVRTVEAYTEILKKKFQCRNKYELVVSAIRYI
jgi:DNA-binding CsgD family transcriptional regulator